MINSEEAKEKIVKITATYNLNILSALGIDTQAFFQLPFPRRERYAKLIQELPDRLVAFIEEAGYLCHEEVQTMLNVLSEGLPEMMKIQAELKNDYSSGEEQLEAYFIK